MMSSPQPVQLSWGPRCLVQIWHRGHFLHNGLAQVRNQFLGTGFVTKDAPTAVITARHIFDSYQPDKDSEGLERVVTSDSIDEFVPLIFALDARNVEHFVEMVAHCPGWDIAFLRVRWMPRMVVHAFRIPSYPYIEPGAIRRGERVGLRCDFDLAVFPSDFPCDDVLSSARSGLLVRAGGFSQDSPNLSVRGPDLIIGTLHVSNNELRVRDVKKNQTSKPGHSGAPIFALEPPWRRIVGIQQQMSESTKEPLGVDAAHIRDLLQNVTLDPRWRDPTPRQFWRGFFCSGESIRSRAGFVLTRAVPLRIPEESQQMSKHKDGLFKGLSMENIPQHIQQWTPEYQLSLERFCDRIEVKQAISSVIVSTCTLSTCANDSNLYLVVYYRIKEQAEQLFAVMNRPELLRPLSVVYFHETEVHVIPTPISAPVYSLSSEHAQQIWPVLQKHAVALMSKHSNVSAVWGGYACQANEWNSTEPAILVAVRSKHYIPINELALPRSLDGFRVDVWEGLFMSQMEKATSSSSAISDASIQSSQSSSSSSSYSINVGERPADEWSELCEDAISVSDCIQPGMSIGPLEEKGISGTLGYFWSDTEAITCHHVVGRVSTNVQQPSMEDLILHNKEKNTNFKASDRVIGEVTQSIRSNVMVSSGPSCKAIPVGVDVALIQLNGKLKVDSSLICSKRRSFLGQYSIDMTSYAKVDDLLDGTAVKAGRTTGLTKGLFSTTQTFVRDFEELKPSFHPEQFNIPCSGFSETSVPQSRQYLGSWHCELQSGSIKIVLCNQNLVSPDQTFNFCNKGDSGAIVFRSSKQGKDSSTKLTPAGVFVGGFYATYGFWGIVSPWAAIVQALKPQVTEGGASSSSALPS